MEVPLFNKLLLRRSGTEEEFTEKSSLLSEIQQLEKEGNRVCATTNAERQKGLFLRQQAMMARSKAEQSIESPSVENGASAKEPKVQVSSKGKGTFVFVTAKSKNLMLSTTGIN